MRTGGCFVLETLYTVFSSRFILLSRKTGWVIRCVFHVYSSSQMHHFGCIQRAGFALEKKNTGLGHRFGAVMKVNEIRHLGSSAFDPPLHRDSAFLYEVTGSNPSRAINSVHPRQARCLSILRKFRHNIRKERTAARLLTSNL